MLLNLKALIVIIGLALVTFHVCKPICLTVMTLEAFTRRRNVWLALTVVAFLSPTFWFYAIFALLTLLWATARDENPLALFVLVTFTVPEAKFSIPAPIVNQLFDLTQYRILSLAILIPAIVRQSPPAIGGRRGLRPADVLLAAFLLLQLVLTMPYESGTHTMRRVFLYGLDTFILFYAFSRLNDRERLADVMACFWLACAITVPIAVFESVRGWLLYTGLVAVWGDPNIFAWLVRGDTLRAQGAMNHSINMGYHLAIGLGFYLYLRTRGVAKSIDVALILAMCAGIIVSGSRGAWVTAILLGLVFLGVRPNAGRQLAGTLVVLTVAVGFMYMTPLKEAVFDRMPFIGTSDQNTVDYRQQLAVLSWQLIQQHPFFGDPFAFLHMEALRQGQGGIIDIVNGYIFTALFSGLVGLFLLVAVFLTCLALGFRALMENRAEDADAGAMGASLVACMIASLAFIATAGYGATTYILCGLLASYAAALAWIPYAAPSASAPFYARPQAN